jgi:hypothetical protein
MKEPKIARNTKVGCSRREKAKGSAIAGIKKML